MGVRTNAALTDFSELLPEEMEQEVKEAAQVSMGTEVGDEDIENIVALCDQVISISEYREQLYDYLKNRMQAIAPNLTILVGELVGARLIAHAGSLMSLAKHPASTVQILGAEKALFRALKTKHETPKYGLIYHASLIGQTPVKHKGKISRVLAAKAALAVRFDALGESESTETGMDGRSKVELRMRSLEQGQIKQISGLGSKGKTPPAKYLDPRQSAAQGTSRAVGSYNPSADMVAGSSASFTSPAAHPKKRKSSLSAESLSGPSASPTLDEEPSKKKKKTLRVKAEVVEA